MQSANLRRRCFVMFLFLGLALFQASAQEADQGGKRLEIFKLDPELRSYIWELLSNEFKTYRMGDNSVAVVDTPEQLRKVSEMVQSLNAIQRDAGSSAQTSLIISVIGASLEGSFAEGTPLPESLRPVANELKAMFPYQSYRLLDSMPVRITPSALDERISALAYQGSSRLGRCTSATEAHCTQNISISRAISGETVKLVNFSYRLQVPRLQESIPATKDGKGESLVYDHLAFTTSVDIAKDQTLVVGKLNPESAQTAYFIAISRLQD